ncbi:MAG: DsbA family oxidoreductase [Myxococcales bacterium]|nr:DsbA family oxidoreductase [Myxococcales bacterium]
MSMRVDVWSDIACPWCYVGKRRLEAALKEAASKGGGGGEVEVVWRAFELDPRAPRVYPGDESYSQRLARKYGTTEEEGAAMCERMTGVAAEEGLRFRFDRIQPGNTFDAHRLLHLARERGKQDALKERLLAAYFEEGEAISDHAVLERLAESVGLDAEEVRETLASDRFATAVRGDEGLAGELGIRGVPFFVVNGRYAVSGAQPAELLARVLTEAVGTEPQSLPEGEACGPDGCAI